MGRLLGILALVGVAWAEPDGAVADPARWTGPHGPPGNTRRSRAMPITRDVVQAWEVRLPGQAIAPPVTWDGTAYVSCQARDGVTLVAIDIASGKKVGSKTIRKAPAGPIHVWSDVVVLQSDIGKISGYKRVGKTFLERWRYSKATSRGGSFAVSGFTVVENEVYVTTRTGSIVRVSPGKRTPVWHDTQGYSGSPAIYGKSVLVFDGGSGRLVSLDRTTGKMLGRSEDMTTGSGASHITVGPRTILFRAPGPMRTRRGSATHCFLKANASPRGGLVPGRLEGLMSFRVTAAVHGTGFLTCEGTSEWQLWKQRGRILARRKHTPDLFENLVPATVVGKVVYFGRWAADIETGEIFWRVAVPGILFGAIPADRLCLIVDNRGTVRAFRSRVGR